MFKFLIIILIAMAAYGIVKALLGAAVLALITAVIIYWGEKKLGELDKQDTESKL